MSSFNPRLEKLDLSGLDFGPTASDKAKAEFEYHRSVARLLNSVSDDALARLVRSAPAATAASARPGRPMAATPPLGRGIKVVSSTDLMARKFEPVTYVVPRYLPQGLTILAGRPKLGKSWLALQLAIAVAEGGDVLGQTCDHGDVLYCALEDTERRAQSRVRQLGEPGRPEQLEFIFEMPRANEGGLSAVRDWLERHPCARLVIIDVFTKVRPATARGDNAYAGDYADVTDWKALADEFGVAILLIHHVRKMAAEDPLEMMSGTNGITGAADTLMVLNRTAQGVTLTGRGREVEEFEKALQFDTRTGRWSVIGDASDARRSDQRKAVMTFLATAPQPLSSREIAEALGERDGNIRQLLSLMTQSGEVRRVGRGRYASAEATDIDDMLTS